MIDLIQRAILAAADVLRSGRRILVSSRAFWSQYSFPPLDQRRDIVRAARAILTASAHIESGDVQGTVADLYGSEGYPTTDLGGGTLGMGRATVYARFRYRQETETEAGTTYTYRFRTFSQQLPWDLPLWALQDMLADAVEALGGTYDLSGGEIESGSVVIY